MLNHDTKKADNFLVIKGEGHIFRMLLEIMTSTEILPILNMLIY